MQETGQEGGSVRSCGQSGMEGGEESRREDGLGERQRPQEDGGQVCGSLGGAGVLQPGRELVQ